MALVSLHACLNPVSLNICLNSHACLSKSVRICLSNACLSKWMSAVRSLVTNKMSAVKPSLLITAVVAHNRPAVDSNNKVVVSQA